MRELHIDNSHDNPAFRYTAPSPTNLGTLMRTSLEDVDLLFSVIVNFVGVALLLASAIFCWPLGLPGS